jgi:hypothetical protein
MAAGETQRRPERRMLGWRLVNEGAGAYPFTRRSLVLQVFFYQVDFAAALKLINASLTFSI